MADFGEHSDPPHIFVTRSVFSYYWGTSSPLCISLSLAFTVLSAYFL